MLRENRIHYYSKKAICVRMKNFNLLIKQTFIIVIPITNSLVVDDLLNASKDIISAPSVIIYYIIKYVCK